MELAIVAGLGLLGYRLAAKGAESRITADLPPPPRDTHAFPFEPDVAVDAMLERDALQAGLHVADAQRTIDGMIRYDQPFVTNDAKQVFNERHAQRRLETYTGTDISFRKKAERGPIFEARDNTTDATVGSGGGFRAQLDVEQQRDALVDRAAFGTRYNNVAPVDRIAVGKGLGIGVDVAAAGGLHSTWRHLPVEDLNAHRINQLQTRTNHGAQGTTQYVDLPTLKTTRVDLSQIAQPITAPHAAGRQAQKIVPDLVELPPVRRNTMRIDHIAPGKSVVAGGGVAHPSVPILRDRRVLGTLPAETQQTIGGILGPTVYDGHAVRETDREWAAQYRGAAYAGAVGTYASKDDHRLKETGREDVNAFFGAAHNASGGYVPQGGAVRSTDREWAMGGHQGAAYAGSNARGGPASSTIIMRDTTRDGASVASGGYVAAGFGGQQSSSAMYVAPSKTMREVVGGALPVLTGSRPGAANSRRDAGFTARCRDRAHAVDHVAGGSLAINELVPRRVELRKNGLCGADGTSGAHGAFTSVSGPRRDPTAIPKNKLPVDNPWAPPAPREIVNRLKEERRRGRGTCR